MRQATLASANARLGLFCLLIAFSAFVLTNASELRDLLPAELRHATLAIIAALSIARMPGRAGRAVLVASPIVGIYVIGGLVLYAIMAAILAAAAPLVGDALISIVQRRDHRPAFALATIALIPALLSLPTLAADGLIDTTYGRERVLLGYWHPKEAGVAFAVPLLIVALTTRKLSFLWTAAASTILWIVGSRNASILVALAYPLHRQFQLSILGGSLVVTAAGLLAWTSEQWFEVANLLVSLRLTVWAEGLATYTSSLSLDMLSGERFGIDNFFIEAYMIAGLWAVPLVVLWLLGIARLVTRRSPLGNWPRVAAVLLVFYACFDSGIASTGNFMHCLLWAVILSPLGARCRRPRVRRGASIVRPAGAAIAGALTRLDATGAVANRLNDGASST